MSDDVIYLIAYAYAYNGLTVPSTVPRNEAFVMGAYDADGDERESVPPCVDFNCGEHIKRDIGTVITGVSNPLVQVGQHGATLFALGYHPNVEGSKTFFRSEVKNYANSDRAWEVCHRA